MRSAALRVLATVLAVSALSPPARAQTPVEAPSETSRASDARYLQRFSDAVAEYQLGHWAEARALFMQAHALNPNARTLRTLGMTAFELRDYTTALRELSASLDDSRRALDARLRAEVEALLDRTWTFVGRFHVRLDPPDAVLAVDGQVAQREPDGSLVLGLGEHTLRAAVSGYVPTQRTLRVEGDEDAALDLKLEAEPPPPAIAPVGNAVTASSGNSEHAPTHTWTWVAAASALGFGGGSLGLWIAGDAELKRLVHACGGVHGCQRGQVDESTLKTLDSLTTASAITAGVAVVATVALFVTEGAEPEARTRIVMDRMTPKLVYRF